MDGAVVVLYNPDLSELKNISCYAGVVDVTYIVDNSPNSNYEHLKSLLDIDQKRIIYKHFPDNLGLCKGMNAGITALKKCGCTWVFTMNSDSCFKNDVISIFRNYIAENDCSDIAILAPLYDFDRHQAISYDGVKPLKRAMMSGNYVNVEIFEKMGGFLEILFVDGLDNDYCIRCRRKGYRILECGSAVMEHMPCKTHTISILGKKIPYGYDSAKRYYGHARSLAFLIRRYKTIYEFSFYIYKFLKILFLFDHKREYLQAYISGTKDGLKAEKESRITAQ